MSFWMWEPRKTVAQRRAEAVRLIQAASRGGRAKSPVTVAGRKIASTFWGQAWCDNLERYRDFAHRLERGRSYLRSGSVIDLQIKRGKISAEVLGSQLYEVEIEIHPVARAAWKAIRTACTGAIGSRLELLSGRLSEPVMARLCADGTGLFPAPSAIQFSCSCPDYATMCKHVAATMYGVGARLDHAPDMLFTLRQVSLDELTESAIGDMPAAPAVGRILAANEMASLFGIELDTAPAAKGGKATRTKTTTTKAKAGRKPKQIGKLRAKPKAKAKITPKRKARKAPARRRAHAPKRRR